MKKKIGKDHTKKGVSKEKKKKKKVRMKEKRA